MAENITLQALIEKVKSDLLAPTNGPNYPIFFVEKVELELQVAVTQEGNAGLEISVLDFVGIKAEGGVARERGHTVTVTLAPILSREEQRELLNKDSRMLDGVERATQSALRKDEGITLAGKTE